MARKEKPGCIRVAKLEISGMTPEQRARWRSISDDCRGIVNCTWRSWLVWHHGNGSREQIVNHNKAVKAWDEGGKKGAKPAWPVEAVPKECAKFIYDEVSNSFPELECTTRELCRNAVVQGINHIKAARGSLCGWAAILIDNQSVPSTTRGVPIRFSNRNAKIEPPDPRDEKALWKLHVTFTRIARPGRKAVTVTDTVSLWSKGRDAQSEVAKLKKIMSGEYTFCGSQVVHDSRKNKWFAMICYRAPVEPAKDLDKSKVAFLRPSSINVIQPGTYRNPVHLPTPWRFEINKRTRRPGFGNHIAAVRKKIFGERRSRQQGYRSAGSANKGHGRNRAMKPIWHLSEKWKNFVKTCNYMVAADVVKQCVEGGVGKLVYFQPSDRPYPTPRSKDRPYYSVRDSRFLTQVGKRDDVPESSGWDYYQIGKRLSDLCQSKGIEFIWRKPSDRESGDNNEQDRRGKTPPPKPPKKRGKRLQRAVNQGG